MVQEAFWPAIIVVAVGALCLGFFVGRFAGGSRKHADELAVELEEKKAESEAYHQQVDEHFDKTATLFVSMAGSYKDLFEHLSSGYEKLSDKSARDLFRERVDSMLAGSALEHKLIADEGNAEGVADPEAPGMGKDAGTTGTDEAVMAQGEASDSPAETSGVAAEAGEADSPESKSAEGTAKPT